MKYFFYISLTLILIILVCGTYLKNSEHNNYDSNEGPVYSDKYYSDPEYRSNIDSIAETNGISSSEADIKLHAVTGGR